ncbi:Exocyst complex component 7 [Gryllus bimaculatus]|nr:Exocyst complex component 7 [Gryllus bimaculatus]
MMYDPSEKRIDIENKLEREMKNLKILKEKVTRCNHLTKGMKKILSSSDNRLAHLEETIVPIYKQTGSLQNQYRNLKHTLKVLDHVIVFYDTSKQMEPIIRAGPSININGESRLQNFLQAMEKLQSAMEYFRTHNADSAEYCKAKSLYNLGADALNKEFKELLNHYSEPVPLLTLLDIVSPTEETERKSESISLSQIPEHIYIELQNIAAWLKENSSDEYVEVFEKKTKKMLLRSSSSTEHLYFTSSNRRSGTLAEDVVDEQEMVNYLMCFTALQKMMQNEKLQMSGIIPVNAQSNAFESLVENALNLVVQDGESIATRAKKCISHHEFSTLLIVFPILKQLQLMLPEYKETVKECSEDVISKFSATYDILHSIAAKALDDFVESIHSDSNTRLPQDGTVHELTSNTLVFLEQLFDFADMIGGILAQKFEYNNALTIALISQLVAGYGERDKNKIILGMYIQKVLNELHQTLCNKSKLYSDIYLQTIFRLNNTHQILKSIKQSGLLDFVLLSRPDFETYYLKMINDDKETYTQSWKKILENIWPLDVLPGANAGVSKLKDKDRAVIKEKFASFNKYMEEIVKLQHGYYIADEELRNNMKEDNKNLLLPKYKEFYEKDDKYLFETWTYGAFN